MLPDVGIGTELRTSLRALTTKPLISSLPSRIFENVSSRPFVLQKRKFFPFRLVLIYRNRIISQSNKAKEIKSFNYLFFKTL